MAENVPEKDKPAESADNKNGSAKGGPKFFLIALILGGLMAGSASAAVIVASLMLRPEKKETAPAPAEKKDEKVSEFIFEDPLIVNVYQTQQRRYLSVKPAFVFKGAAAMDKVKSNEAELQHIMIGILKRKTLDQLDEPEVANSIGREVQEAVNLKFELNGALTSVYFTEFIVQ